MVYAVYRGALLSANSDEKDDDDTDSVEGELIYKESTDGVSAV